MKSIYLILIFGILLIISCKDQEDHLEEMSASDLVALEGMSENYEAALRYNDSLIICNNEPLSCDSINMFHYDDMFHQFDNMFNFYHDDFSHENINDDHHHLNGQTVRHGNMMGQEECHNDQHGEYHHNNESLEAMMHLRELHDEVHPK